MPPQDTENPSLRGYLRDTVPAATFTIDYQGKKADASVSGSRTKVTIDGNKAKRGKIEVGMTCTFVYYGPGTRAKELICRN